MIKRHNPQTVRKNVGENYHGCLRIVVHRSSDLYRRIEGWATASMTVSADPTGEAQPPVSWVDGYGMENVPLQKIPPSGVA
jgi:hypothetical protein